MFRISRIIRINALTKYQLKKVIYYLVSSYDIDINDVNHFIRSVINDQIYFMEEK